MSNVENNAPRQRRRAPRVPDNPMALIAHEVMVEAERAFRRADALSESMEPHLLKRVNNSSIYGYTNDRADRNVPPGDVLLAAAVAAGISIDEKLGLARQSRDIEELRTQVAEMREEMAILRAAIAGAGGTPDEQRDRATTRTKRAAERRAWAQRSPADTPSSTATPTVQQRRPTRRP